MSLMRVAITGYPNVGKSTLFNRLVGRRVALVHDTPGLTRDRREEKASLLGMDFILCDTGGVEDPKQSELSQSMYHQTLQGIQNADVILFVIDARSGATHHDREWYQFLLTQRKPVIVVANKAEGAYADKGLVDAYELGAQQVVCMSAEHGLGLADLYEALSEHTTLPDVSDDDEGEVTPDKPISIAIMGKPNVGKSTLINQLIGEDRLVVADMPGVTRDSIAVEWDYAGRFLKLVDTAGMRRFAKSRQEPLENLSVISSKQAIQYAEAVVLVIDGSQVHTHPIDKQDLGLADYISREGRSLIIAINKWDKQPEKQKYLNELYHQIDLNLTQVKGIKCIPVSALKTKNLDKLMDGVLEAYDIWNRRISTSKLNNWLRDVTQMHPPPLHQGRRIRLKYITQVKSRPPTFVVFSTKAGDVPESYKRYLINKLRQDFSLPGTPIRLLMRSNDNPYDEKDG